MQLVLPKRRLREPKVWQYWIVLCKSIFIAFLPKRPKSWRVCGWQIQPQIPATPQLWPNFQQPDIRFGEMCSSSSVNPIGSLRSPVLLALQLQIIRGPINCGHWSYGTNLTSPLTRRHPLDALGPPRPPVHSWSPNSTVSCIDIYDILVV